MATPISKKGQKVSPKEPAQMTELELLKRQYHIQMELQELGQQAGHLQEHLNAIEAELKSRVVS